MLLSTLHHEAVIGEKAKPEIIHYYNTSKGGVDVLDHMCASYNTSRKTQRWPCCMFFGLLNIASINAFILYNEAGQARTSKDKVRRIFLQKVAYDLAKPLAQQRVDRRTIHGSLLHCVKECFELQLPPPQQQADGTGGRARCHFCHWKTASRCRSRCFECGQIVCTNHYKLLCPNCYQ